MSAQLGNGSVTFGDGSVQTTKTPTIVSAFTNDSNYTTISAVSATYATKATAVASMTCGGSANINIYYYDVNGNYIGQANGNCNCNC